MPTFLAIAAMSENRAIGEGGKIPWHLPEEYAWFKHKTMGGTLIMGRKTYESIGKPLPGRETVVISRNFSAEGVTICNDISTLDKTLSKLPKPYWICGGVEIYRQFLKKCTTLYLTRVKHVTSGDAFFPPFEDKFEFEYAIYENNDFRVERWKHLFLSEKLQLEFEQEAWPFPPTHAAPPS
jgi:dihydrofolate reductase